MVDYDNAEITSLEEVFPNIQFFYATFIGSSFGIGNLFCYYFNLKKVTDHKTM